MIIKKFFSFAAIFFNYFKDLKKLKEIQGSLRLLRKDFLTQRKATRVNKNSKIQNIFKNKLFNK